MLATFLGPVLFFVIPLQYAKMLRVICESLYARLHTIDDNVASRHRIVCTRNDILGIYECCDNRVLHVSALSEL